MNLDRIEIGGFWGAVTAPAQPAPAQNAPRRSVRHLTPISTGLSDSVFALIVGNQEVSQKAGVSKALVHAWTSTPHRGFPAPIVTLSAGPLYWWPEVGEWLITQVAAAATDHRRIILPPISQTARSQPRPPYLPLVAVAEIGARTGVTNATVCNWRHRYARRTPRFPTSVADLAMGQIYWWPQVQHWLVAAGKPGTLAGAR
jgi:hypothetical protein